MLRLHHAATAYGTLPSDILGFTRGTWAAWIVTMAVSMVGDEARAAMVKRLQSQSKDGLLPLPIPVVPIR